MEDRDLRRNIRAAAHGDEEAAALLFDEYHPRVYRYALAKLRIVSDAEDVASETFARILRDLDRFRWKGSGFEAWLFRIASNLITDRFRAGARERPSDTISLAFDKPSPDDPEATVLLSEERAHLMRLLDTLPEDQREVLTLRFAGGLDTHETGRAMNRRTNAVRQLQFRALQNLRAQLHMETAR